VPLEASRKRLSLSSTRESHVELQQYPEPLSIHTMSQKQLLAVIDPITILVKMIRKLLVNEVILLFGYLGFG